MKIHKGGCHCGAVRFAVKAELGEIIYCHCDQCRRQTGHYLAATSAPQKKLSLTGEDNLSWFQSSATARRGFCRICGSGLFWKNQKSSSISILAGALDQPTGLKVAGHLFVSQKPDYYEITDGLPQHQRWDK